MNYYNDNDQKACAWLREWIAAGELPSGDVEWLAAEFIAAWMEVRS